MLHRRGIKALKNKIILILFIFFHFYYIGCSREAKILGEYVETRDPTTRLIIKKDETFTKIFKYEWSKFDGRWRLEKGNILVLDGICSYDVKRDKLIPRIHVDPCNTTWVKVK